MAINIGAIANQGLNYLSQLFGGKAIDYDIDTENTLSGRPGQTPLPGTQSYLDLVNSNKLDTKINTPVTKYSYKGTDTPYFDDTTYAPQTAEQVAEMNARAEAEAQAQAQARIDAENARIAQEKVQKTADERGYYQSQIDALNNLLGYIETSKAKGLESLGSSYANQVAQANKVYSDQELANQKAKLGGIEQVDQYAGQNYNSLMSLLRNAGAGSSSVARDLMPSLVARAAGTRRQNVFNTAGENQAAIDTARTSGLEDIENKRRSAEQSFLESIGGKQIEALGQKSGYELQRDMADGTGYEAAKAASAATQGQIDSRYNELAGLFDKYKPTYSTAKAPDLSQYTADKAAIKVGGGQADPSMYYSNLFKKKQEQGL